MTSLHQYCAVLGISAGASAEALEETYKDLVKVWHPDRFTHDPKLQAKTQEKLKEINRAYKFLKNSGFGTSGPSSNQNAYNTTTKTQRKQLFCNGKFFLLTRQAFLPIFEIAVPFIFGILIWSMAHPQPLSTENGGSRINYEYLSMGDTREVVRGFKGNPERIMTNMSDAGETWTYANHQILFDRHGRMNGFSAKEI